MEIQYLDQRNTKVLSHLQLEYVLRKGKEQRVANKLQDQYYETTQEKTVWDTRLNLLLDLFNQSFVQSIICIQSLRHQSLVQLYQASHEDSLFIHSYRYRLAQFLVSTGNSINIGFSQFKSITPLKLMTSVRLSSGETVAELLTVRSDKELEQIIAYSRAQIDVSQNFVFYLHIATYQKGPQAVENPSQNLSYVAVAVFVPLKLVIYRYNSISQVAESYAPSGARVYLVPQEKQ
ncbi:MAG: hypothetical protein EZS28_013214 [Streblomastix strix]|uniref:Uncharacterized protein n=1 Tax=Streblomastix strix TaxID=222440 RepID=A0A5J4WA55_9EUKA|nr:MAG: hypothetical protein EZS28_013214 [Streblomastix strix]